MDMEYDVCIVGGLGHVGLPLGLCFADAGLKVVAYELNTDAIRDVSCGKVPFVEQGAQELLQRVLNLKFFVSSDKEVISKSKYVIVVIGTPMDEYLTPKYKLFIEFFDEIMPFLRNGQHVILRSTVYPGTTENMKNYLKKKGKNVKITFCPERIAEGKAIEELHALPQLIGAFDDASFDDARRLFSVLTCETIRLSPMESELAKLFTNSWRYIMFSIANQFYQLSTAQGIDFYKVYDAITHHYPRAAAFPKAGFAAGPCLFKDTMQLSAFSNNHFFIGHAAMLINEGMPNFIVAQLKSRYNLAAKTVGILGMSFKADIDDKRESLSYKLKKLLHVEAENVLCSDVYIKDPGFVSTDEMLAKSDIVILSTPHKEYRSLVFPSKVDVIDIWNYLDPKTPS